MIKKFVFTKENLKKMEHILTKYPLDRKKSAVVPLLDLGQRQNDGYLSQEIIEYIASLLQMHPVRVQEVASFYTMFNLKPVGKYKIQVCGTTPCWLRGSDKVMKKCKERLKIEEGETTSDSKFTLVEVECLGACSNAPVVQINDDYYYDLDEGHIETIIDKLDNNDVSSLKTGSQTGRKSSKPLDGVQ
jgi:NADH-quinone oxidoreductase E subunit